jgi:hypothetical protein
MRLADAATALLALALPLSATGCIKQMLIDGQIEGTRQASDAFDTIGDYELARAAAQAGLVQFEGMHKLSPTNEDALFMLLKGWTGYAFAFAEDDYELAEDAGDEDLADYHRKRANMGYERAIFYGLELIGHKAEGFEGVKKTEPPLKAWLEQSFTDKEDAELLFWTGYAWMARADLMKNDELGGGIVGELFIGKSMMERAVALDPSYNYFSGLVALGAYHARPLTGPGEMDQSKALFEQALQATQRKALVIQLNYAKAYACAAHDGKLYNDLMNEVLQAGDPDPMQRLTNAIAKRRAKRYLQPSHTSDCSFKK